MALALETINQLKNISILDIAARYLQIEKENSSLYKAKCPFHDDTDASLKFYPETNTFYCFGCGAGKGGSDVISFIQLIEEWDFVEATKHLSKVSGIPLESSREAKRIIKILDSLEKQNKRFVKALELFEPGKLYLKNRGVDEALYKKWELGVVPKKERFYLDKEDRITLPLRDYRGKIRGWAFRAIDDSLPKIVSSSNSKVLNKQHILSGIEKVAKNASRLVVVEGYFDMIALNQFGVNNVVATHGATLYSEQIDLIKRKLDLANGHVLLVFDGDNPGQKGMAQASVLLEKEGIETKIYKLPKGSDPDTWIKKESDLFSVEEKFAAARPLIELQILHFYSSYINELAGVKTEFLDKLLKISKKYGKDFSSILLAHSHHPSIKTYEAWLNSLILDPLIGVPKEIKLTTEEKEIYLDNFNTQEEM